MRIAYKISIPLVVLVTALILFVAIHSGSNQKEIIANGQKSQATIVLAQFQENKERELASQKENLAFLASMASEISINYLYNYNFEALNEPLKELLSYNEIKAIHVYESNTENPVITLGKEKPHYKTIKKNVVWKETLEVLGYVELYYDDTAIINYFKQAAQNITQELQKSNATQNSFIDEVTQKQVIFNLCITLLILFALLQLVYHMVTKPLTSLKHGLDSFFEVLQGKETNIKSIDIKSNDEFGNMATSINENIEVSLQLHEEIHELNSNLEEKIEKRTKQVKQLLDNASEGFLSFNSDLIIDDEYSKECESIFGCDIAGQNIKTLLFSSINEEEQNLILKMIQDIFNPKIPERRKNVLMRLFPEECVIQGKSIKVAYKNLENQKMMLILTDVTENKILEEKIELEKKRLKMIVSVVSDLEEFYEIVDDFKQFAKNRTSYLESSENYLNMLTLYFRKIHTFKGNFAQKDLVYIVGKLHEYENRINTVVKNPNRTFEEFKKLIEDENLERWLDEDMEVLTDILDKKVLNNKDQLSVSRPIIEMVEKKLEALVNYPKHERNVTYEEILDDVSKIKKRSLVELLGGYIKFVEQLSERLEKKLYPMEVLGDDIYVKDSIKPFVKSLVHIFRNSIDHGIEPLADRMESSKDDKATINCMLQHNKKELILQIMDDGNGIDVAKIKEKALALNLYTQSELDSMSQEALLKLIFSDNFSTKDEVTELSGRGVGLSAVLYELEQLHGSVEIETELHKGTTFTFTIPMKQIY